MDESNFKAGEKDRFRERNASNRICFGIVLALVGIGYLLRTIGVIPYYSLHELWPVLLVVIGVVLLIKNGVRNNGWWILILVGVANLIPSFTINGHSSRQLFWPAMIIIAGVMIAIRPRRSNSKCYGKRGMPSNIISDSRITIDVAFGGRKEIITAKDFKGGVVSVSFGGSEINLSQADFAEESVVLDCHISFGGLELVVPSHWEIQNQIRPTFGAIEDERMIHTNNAGEVKKKLILQGSCTCGGIEIKSF